jgi:hypothetical protein
VTNWYVDRVHETSTRVCTRCGRPLAFVGEVGWVDNAGGGYDMCEDDPYGNHLPGPEAYAGTSASTPGSGPAGGS